MSGHSKWASIKHSKGKADKQRSKVFSKLSKEISVAAKLGDKDPAMNPRLRSAIQAAKSANMPKDNIERAIAKSSANSETNYENLRYEGFGPDKIAVIVEALTDNKNRTASNVRSIFVKSGGNLGTQGSASHNFNQLGIIKIDKKEISDEQIFELAIESGADECISNDEFHEIQCPMSEIYNVKKNLEKTIANFISTEIEWVPLNSVDVEKDKVEAAIEFLEALEDDDDVQSVYSNINLKIINAYYWDRSRNNRFYLFFQDGKIVDVIEMPNMPEGKKNKKQVNGAQIYHEISSRIKNIKKEHIKVIIEQVSAMPGQGVTSMFNFGQSFGILKGICSAMQLPMYFVRPTKWKKYFNLINSEKDASRTKAIEVFPYFSSELSRKKDSNKADAILIASFYYETYKLEE